MGSVKIFMDDDFVVEFFKETHLKLIDRFCFIILIFLFFFSTLKILNLLCHRQ